MFLNNVFQLCMSRVDQSGEQQDLVDVDFDFFNFEEIDFKAISLLCRQLFSHDAKDFDFGKVADFLIADNALGSTVKCDGEQSDPYAFCACLDLAKYADVGFVLQSLSPSIVPNSQIHSMKPFHPFVNTSSPKYRAILKPLQSRNY